MSHLDIPQVQQQLGSKQWVVSDHLQVENALFEYLFPGLVVSRDKKTHLLVHHVVAVQLQQFVAHVRYLDPDGDVEKHAKEELEEEECKKRHGRQLERENHREPHVGVGNRPDVSQDVVVRVATRGVVTQGQDVDHLSGSISHKHFQGVVDFLVDQKTRPVKEALLLDFMKQAMVVVVFESVHEFGDVIQVC